MLIKTISGYEVGGGISASNIEKAINSVNSGYEAEIDFIFLCSLNPGVYFLNSGVLGANDSEETFLHRVLDGVVFKVLPINENISTAIVDFDCRCSINMRFVN
jgi:lipopolysaccharide transport system ATP-binding protein